jgi:hypothetical protein
VFTFTLVDNDNAESLGVVAFAVPNWKPGDVSRKAGAEASGS